MSPFGHCKHPGTCGCNTPGTQHNRAHCPHWIEEQHTEYRPKQGVTGWRVTYWKNSLGGSVASGRTGADCAVVSYAYVNNHGRSGGYSDVGTFPLPTTDLELDRWLRALDAAYEAGKRARSLEITNLLKGE